MSFIILNHYSLNVLRKKIMV